MAAPAVMEPPLKYGPLGVWFLTLEWGDTGWWGGWLGWSPPKEVRRLLKVPSGRLVTGRRVQWQKGA